MKSLQKTKCRRNLLIFSILTAVAVLSVCTKSSFLYPMNDWVDVQCFLTMGKSLLHGMIPYVDLYEQKGPVLYFVYALAALISDDSFLGVFLLELTTFTVFLYYCGRIARLYLGNTKLVYLVQVFLAVITCTSTGFSHGGSVEQLSLMFFAYGLCSVLSAVHEKRSMTFAECLVNGLFAGCAFWIKYTMAGFYLGLAIFVLIWYIGWVQDWKKLLAAIGEFLLGFAIISIVVLVFFWIAGGLDELNTAYFDNNINLYHEESELSKWEQIVETYEHFMEINVALPILVGAGLTFFLIRLHTHYKDLIAAVLCYFGLVIGTCWGKHYAYYSLVLFSFTIFGLVGIAWLLQSPRAMEFYKMLVKELPWLGQVVVALTLILSISFCFENSGNVYLMDYKKEELPQYQFAETINQVEDATVLNFGFLDGGFYYAADVLPTCKFFCTFNVDAPGMWDMQYKFVNEMKVDFIITRRRELSSYWVNDGNYELVDTATFYFEGVNYNYYLYKLKENHYGKDYPV